MLMREIHGSTGLGATIPKNRVLWPAQGLKKNTLSIDPTHTQGAAFLFGG